ncbi:MULTISPECIES: BTAD domain-containing putative transcriptional regulator [unclassified Variovorax]|uniref:BTAD domain-containing putative transcriptional regulator n=1 Tax=unclassified Variovorax TaxID=663243 RepID=UPI003ECF44CB
MAGQEIHNLGETLARSPATRIQLCGRLTVRIEGRRIEDDLPGRQGRLLFVYLTAHRARPSSRAELMSALWPNRAPAASDTALSALLTKLRSVLGAGVVVGKPDVRMTLPSDAWIDLEAATEGLHRASSAVSQQDWARGWGPSRVALHIAQRGFHQDHDAPWVEDIRSKLEDVLVRAHECVAAIGLGLSGSELASAERSARALIKLAPYRESGYRYLMKVLATQGNVAEALLTYEQLRRLLREELGASPGATTDALHRQLLQGHGVQRGALVRELQTVLFTDIVSSTERLAALGDHAWRELLARHHAIVRQELARFDGREIDTAGDGFLIALENPAQAMGCACAIIKSVSGLGIAIRAGIHTGECEVLDGRISGIAVHVGARISALAGPNELLVSSTVKDLSAGSGIGFDDRGAHSLRGVPGTWRTFAVDLDSVPGRSEA